MGNFKELLETLNHPQMRHAAFVHLPIALTVLGIALTLLAALYPKNRTCRFMALGAYAILIVACFVTVNSGEGAEDAIGRKLTAQEYDILHEHEEMAEKLWLFAAGIFLLLGLSAVPKKAIGTTAVWLAVVVSAVAALWAANTAHLGGTLVYVHGVGTPDSLAPVSPQISTDSTDPHVVFFVRNIEPILVEHCFKCHNPAKVADRKSGRLDQTTRATMLKGGRSGPAIVPGKPEESLLISRVKQLDPESDLMPPEPDHKLTDEQIAALEQWIRDGAAWDNTARQ